MRVRVAACAKASQATRIARPSSAASFSGYAIGRYLRDRSRTPPREDDEISDTLAEIIEDSVRQFIDQNPLDAAAERALRELPLDAQQRVIDEGPCMGSNKSAVLISRIRRVAGQVPGASEHGQTAAEMGSMRGAGALEKFIRENDLDSAAVKALMEVPSDIQWKVISEGMVTGRNRSAILIGRVRRALSGGSAQVPEQRSGFGGSHSNSGSSSSGAYPSLSYSSNSAALERFVCDNDLDGYAEKTLREQSADVQALVIAEGPVTGENKSKILMGRVRRAQQHPSKGPSGMFTSSGNAPPPPHGLPPPGTEAMAACPPPGAAWYNPWGYWTHYVHHFGGAQAIGYPPGPYGTLSPAPYSPGQPPPPMMPYSASSTGTPPPTIEDFVRQNGLDSSASKTLRDQRVEVQLKVIGEGFLTGANKSAVLMSRVRRVVEQMAREQASPCWMSPRAGLGHDARREPVKDPVSSFIRDNNLDAGAGQALREQPQSVQKRVLDEGPITGTNRSAILISRIRRIQQTPF